MSTPSSTPIVAAVAVAPPKAKKSIQLSKINTSVLVSGDGDGGGEEDDPAARPVGSPLFK